MTLTPPQWTLAFAAALATHALAAALLPQPLSKDSSDPPPLQPMRVSLVTPPAPAIPTPVVMPPTPEVVQPPPQPAPVPDPVVRQSEPEVSPTPEVVQPPPQPAPVPDPVKAAPLAQQESVASINRVPVAPPQAAPRESTAPASGDNTTPAATEEPPSNITTAAAPTPVQDVVNLARLKSQYVQTATHWLNKHKRYPRRAEYRGYEGTVLVTFVVSRHGEILDYKIKHSSGNMSIIAYGAQVREAQQAAERLREEAIEAEILDLRTLKPLDTDAILETARKTGKVLIVHSATGNTGVGAEVAALIAQEAFEWLDAPIQRLTGLDIPVPFSPPLEDAYRPGAQKIVERARALAEF